VRERTEEGETNFSRGEMSEVAVDGAEREEGDEGRSRERNCEWTN
jgi:hypothetical protein